MTDKAATAPVLEARLAGMAYLYIIAAGLFVELAVRGALVAPGDGAATVANILGAETLWRVGFVAELFVLVCDVLVAVLLYRVLRPAGEALALLAAGFRLVMAAMLATNALNHLQPLLLFAGADSVTVPSRGELEGLALHALRLHAATYAAGLVFFGLACVFAGLGILRSRFLPRAIGALMVLAGVCYLVNSLTGFLAPHLAAGLFPFILLPCLIAELALALWLLLRGVDRARWIEQARGRA